MFWTEIQGWWAKRCQYRNVFLSPWAWNGEIGWWEVGKKDSKTIKITFVFLQHSLILENLRSLTATAHSHSLSALLSCCIKDRDKPLLLTWSWKTVMLRLTCFAMGEHISLMFAGSNLLHHNLLTESLDASLGDKWNCFPGMHFICNFPMKEKNFEYFLHQAVASSEKHGGGEIFQRFSLRAGRQSDCS